MEKTKSQIVFDAVGTNLPPSIFDLIKELDTQGDSNGAQTEVKALQEALKDNENEIAQLKAERDELQKQVEFLKESLETAADAYPEETETEEE